MGKKILREDKERREAGGSLGRNELPGLQGPPSKPELDRAAGAPDPDFAQSPRRKPTVQACARLASSEASFLGMQMAVPWLPLHRVPLCRLPPSCLPVHPCLLFYGDAQPVGLGLH